MVSALAEFERSEKTHANGLLTNSGYIDWREAGERCRGGQKNRRQGNLGRGLASGPLKTPPKYPNLCEQSNQFPATALLMLGITEDLQAGLLHANAVGGIEAFGPA